MRVFFVMVVWVDVVGCWLLLVVVGCWLLLIVVGLLLLVVVGCVW